MSAFCVRGPQFNPGQGIPVTQHGKRYPSGEIVICSKSNIKGVIHENVSRQNGDNTNNIKDSMIIALWEISEGTFLHLGC